MPLPIPDCHLVRTAILYLPFGESQPRCFPQHCSPVLSSFAGMVSRGNIALGRGHGRKRFAPLSPHVHARQATLHTAHDSVHRIAGSSSASYTARKYHDGSTTVHKNRSPRKQGRVNHAIGYRPESASAHGALPPSTHPKLGVSSRHQRFHRCALQRIFRPSLGNGRSD